MPLDPATDAASADNSSSSATRSHSMTSFVRMAPSELPTVRCLHEAPRRVRRTISAASKSCRRRLFVQLALLLELRCITMHDMESQLTIRLPADLSEALARATRKSGLRTSDIVRTALRDYLNTPSTSGPRPAERVRGLIGSLDSGIPDLAEQHREYVIESLKRGK